LLYYFIKLKNSKLILIYLFLKQF